MSMSTSTTQINGRRTGFCFIGDWCYFSFSILICLYDTADGWARPTMPNKPNQLPINDKPMCCEPLVLIWSDSCLCVACFQGLLQLKNWCTNHALNAPRHQHQMRPANMPVLLLLLFAVMVNVSCVFVSVVECCIELQDAVTMYNQKRSNQTKFRHNHNNKPKQAQHSHCCFVLYAIVVAFWFVLQ